MTGLLMLLILLAVLAAVHWWRDGLPDEPPYDWQHDHELARLFARDSEEGILRVWKEQP